MIAILMATPRSFRSAKVCSTPSDSNRFERAEDLDDAVFNGWSHERHGKEYMPLYEGKMLSHFDHRFSTYQRGPYSELGAGTPFRLTDEQHNDPDFEPVARYWVDRAEARAR